VQQRTHANTPARDVIQSTASRSLSPSPVVISYCFALAVSSIRRQVSLCDRQSDAIFSDNIDLDGSHALTFRVFGRTPTHPYCTIRASGLYRVSSRWPGTIKLDHRCHVKSVATRRPSWPLVTASTIAPVALPLSGWPQRDVRPLEDGAWFGCPKSKQHTLPGIRHSEGYADFLLVQREGKTTGALVEESSPLFLGPVPHQRVRTRAVDLVLKRLHQRTADRGLLARYSSRVARFLVICSITSLLSLCHLLF